MNKYAVFGNPIKHSRSPFIHAEFASQYDLDINYDAIEASIEGFEAQLSAFFDQDAANGCNITLPFKTRAANWVDQLTDVAQRCGAVNTIIRNQDGSFTGDNTDGLGLVNDLRANQIDLTSKRLLILGAGGAARGVIPALLQQNPTVILIANRTSSKAVELMEHFASDQVIAVESKKSLNNLEAESIDIIINATSASLQNQLPDMPPFIMNGCEAIYDMVYGAKPSAFLQFGETQNVPLCIDGLGMLVEQAAQSFYLWSGFKPNTQAVLNKLRLLL